MTTTNVETVSSGKDKALIALFLVLVIAGLVGFTMLEQQGSLVQWAVLLASLVAAVVAFLLSTQGQQLVAFGKDSKRELEKVVWPTRQEATQMTLYVFGFVVIMSLFLWLTDKTLEWVLYDLILGWRK
jgi:preprotein translocase subunit SecE